MIETAALCFSDRLPKPCRKAILQKTQGGCENLKMILHTRGLADRGWTPRTKPCVGRISSAVSCGAKLIYCGARLGLAFSFDCLSKHLSRNNGLCEVSSDGWGYDPSHSKNGTGSERA